MSQASLWTQTRHSLTLTVQSLLLCGTTVSDNVTLAFSDYWSLACESCPLNTRPRTTTTLNLALKGGNVTSRLFCLQARGTSPMWSPTTCRWWRRHCTRPTGFCGSTSLASVRPRWVGVRESDVGTVTSCQYWLVET